MAMVQRTDGMKRAITIYRILDQLAATKLEDKAKLADVLKLVGTMTSEAAKARRLFCESRFGTLDYIENLERGHKA